MTWFTLVLIMIGGAAVAECRLALALGLDVSGSVDAREYRLQLDGLAAALEAPEVQSQILTLPDTPIWISVFEWAGASYQRPVLDWRALRSADDIASVAGRLRATRARRAAGSTAIGSAMYFAELLMRERPGCWSYTLDLSGDGESNDGQLPWQVRTEPRFGAITINGLVIGSDITRGRDERQMEMMALSAYYRTRVIWGPGAFIEVAQGFDDFERAMRRKLLRETRGMAIGLLDHP